MITFTTLEGILPVPITLGWLTGNPPFTTERPALLAAMAERCGLPSNHVPQAGLSLSHTRNLLIVAGIPKPAVGQLSPYRIGIDAEAIRPLALPRILRFFATPQDREWWQAQPNGQQAALQLWTQKEAAYKAFLAKDRKLLNMTVTAVTPIVIKATQVQHNTALQWTLIKKNQTTVDAFAEGLTFWLTPAEHWVSLCITANSTPA
jgi:phosphopantetheinyl transferase